MTSDNTWYFAYGSNLLRQQMIERTGSLPESHTACLKDFRFVFRKLGLNEVYADIVPSSGSTVRGVVYLCSNQALMQLDFFEGVAADCYRRILVQVATDDGQPLWAVAYRGGRAFSDEEGKPSQDYLNRVLCGAREHQLEKDYIDSIERQGTSCCRRFL